jgi:hypothetical protein
MAETKVNPPRELIYRAAIQIFGGMVASGNVNNKNNFAAMRNSYDAAVHMAKNIFKPKTKAKGGKNSLLEGGTDPWVGGEVPFPW